jgi:hypothetical protein
MQLRYVATLALRLFTCMFAIDGSSTRSTSQVGKFGDAGFGAIGLQLGDHNSGAGLAQRSGAGRADPLATPAVSRWHRRRRRRSKPFFGKDRQLKSNSRSNSVSGTCLRSSRAQALLTDEKPLQDGLGLMNDMQAAHELTAELTQPADQGGTEIAREAGVVLGWHDRELVEREPKLRKQLRRLRRAKGPRVASPHSASEDTR